jgi:hypothetical protein
MMRSNFLKVSVFVVIVVLAAFSVLGSAKAGLPAQDPTATPPDTAVPTLAPTTLPTIDVTLVPTMDGTTAPTIVATTGGGTDGTGGTGGTVATPTAAATFDESEAFPPCPEVIMPTEEAATGGDVEATTEATAVSTVDATMDATTEATLSATMDMPTAEGTEEATPVVGTFEEEEGCIFQAELSGANERPDPGDPDGMGMSVVTLSRPAGNAFGQVCFEIEVSGITLPAIAAHIHRGTEDVAGPIVVPLSAPDKDGIARGCTNNVNRGTIRLIVTNPSDFYVNVHTSDFPKGAVRGQLMPVEDEGTATP